MRFKRKVIAGILLTMLCPFIDGNVWLFALQQPRTEPQKNVKEIVETANQPNGAEISKEIRALAKEIRQLNAQQRKMTDLLFLKIEQDRLDKLTDRFAAIESELRILMARDAQLDFRLKNIDREFLTRSFLNRSEGERIIRTEIENEKEQIAKERTRLEFEEQKLRQEINITNSQVELIRVRLLTNSNGTTIEDSNDVLEYYQEKVPTKKSEIDEELLKENKK
ncbi:MAG: hypothetical protein IPK14_01570 [Blastocatellia bacterium]|nr:hypothetical protein [Blastocatellia bacterium]MBL8194651.1 hypothetical protein [Blastocatellia bacterium]MBN8721585.1 hypothetical protein [Acidobacteriota bacterium]